MKNSLSPKALNPKLFFSLLFLYQLFFTFQGLDLSDEGFFGTFYQQIFNHPDSVQYNFMFWLSGVVGGAFDYVFGGLGIWGQRLFATLITTATIILVYNLLKKYLDRGRLQIALFIVLVTMNNQTKVFHYNFLSVLLYVTTAILLFKGLQKGKSIYLFLSGLCIALDTFTRIPSVVNLGLVLVIFYYGWLYKTKFLPQLINAVIFGAGFVAGSAGVLLLIKLVGHWEVFINALILVRKLGSGAEESAYGISALIMQFFNAYYASFKVAVIVLIILAIAVIIVYYLQKTSWYRKWMSDLVRYGVLLGIGYLVVTRVIDNYVMLYFLTGFSLIAGALIVFSNAEKEIKVLAFIGCYILLAYPLGSGAGLYSVGIYSLWFAFPIAFDYFFNQRFLDARYTMGRFNIPFNIAAFASERQLRHLKNFVAIACIIAGLFYSWYYPFFDYHERSKMVYTTNSKYLNVYTTRERATVMNELLTESAKYVKPGDYTLAYHSIPMFHYATRTVPFVHNSMPWFYQASVFREELDGAVKRTGVFPVVVMQRRKTVGKAGSTWPDPAPYYDTAWYKKNWPRDSTLNSFLETNHYQKAWENEMFTIMVPQKTP